jgi:hypothetical protein
VNAKEAAGMDPAKRLLLEVAYETFENGEFRSLIDFKGEGPNRRLINISRYAYEKDCWLENRCLRWKHDKRL